MKESTKTTFQHFPVQDWYFSSAQELQEEKGAMSWKEAGLPCLCAPIGPFSRHQCLQCCCYGKPSGSVLEASLSATSPHWATSLLLTVSVRLALSLFSQLYAKLQCIKAEIQDVNNEHVTSRQELEQTQNELTRELKFKWVSTITAVRKLQFPELNGSI